VPDATGPVLAAVAHQPGGATAVARRGLDADVVGPAPAVPEVHPHLELQAGAPQVVETDPDHDPLRRVWAKVLRHTSNGEPGAGSPGVAPPRP